MESQKRRADASEPAFANDVTIDSGIAAPSAGVTVASQVTLDGSASVHGLADMAVPRIDGYRITGKLGEGGMGVVWKAIQISAQRPVALKLASAASLGSERARIRFQREVELTARLEHPNIARVYDGDQSHGICYYAMELIDGVPLDQHVTAIKATRRRILELMVAVCRAVEHAHQKAILHRDLKPGNILVDRAGQPHVLDFGLAKAMEGEQQLSLDGAVAGTPAFMSPEQAAGRNDHLDTRSDVYTLGVILFNLLTGRFPHDITGTCMDVMKRVAEQEPTRLKDIQPRPDRDLDAILAKTLSHDPDRRYGTAGGLAADLERYLKGDPIEARPPTIGYLLNKRMKKHRVPLMVAAAVLALLMGTGVWAYVRVTRERNAAITANIETQRQRSEAEKQKQEALEQKKQAVASEARAQANEKHALAEQAKAELQLADSLVAQGDAVGLAQHWDAARLNFEQAEGLFRKLNVPTTTADLGLWSAYAAAPGPLMACTPRPGAWVTVRPLPDGRSAVVLPITGQLKVIDLLTGRAIRDLPLAPQIEIWYGMALLDSGKTVLCASKPTLRLVDVQSGNVIRSFDNPSKKVYLESMAVSSDQRHVVVADNLFSGRSEVDICDLTDGRRTPMKALDGALSVAWSPDGKWIVLGADKGRIEIHSAATGETTRKLDAQGLSVVQLAFSPDSQVLASGDALGLVKTWDLAAGRQLCAARAHSSEVRSLAFSSDGKTLLTSSTDGSIKLWEADSLQLKQLIAGGLNAIWGGAVFSSDGTLAIAGNGRVTTWSLAQPLEVLTMRSHPWRHPHVEFAADGSMLLATGERSSIYDVATGRLCRQFGKGQGNAALLPDGRRVVAVQGVDDSYNTLELWDTVSGIRRYSVRPAQGQVRGMALLADGKTVVCSFGSNGIHLFDAESGQRRGIVCTTRPSNLGGAALAASPQGNEILGAIASDLCLWETTQADRPVKLGSHVSDVTCVACSRDGRLAASASHSSWSYAHRADIKIWDMVSRQQVLAFADLWSGPQAIAISDDSKRVMCGFEDGTVALCDTGGAEIPRVIGSHEAPVTSVALSPDGQRAASVSSDGTVKLWDFSRLQTYRDADQLEPAWKKIRENPADPAAMAMIGQWYAFRGKWDWAVELLEKARAAGHDVSSLILARCYWQLSNYAAALREFQNAAQHHEAAEQALAMWMGGVRRDMSERPEFVAAKKTAAALVGEKKYDAALDAYAKLVAAVPFDADCRAARSALLAHNGKFKEAAEDLEEAAGDEPGNPFHLFRAAAIRLYIDDRDAYRRDSRLMFDRFSTDPARDVAERVAKTGLLDPVPGQDIEALEKLCDRALDGAGADGIVPWLQNVKGLAEYRAGHFEAAIELLTKCQGNLNQAEGSLADTLLLAMAEYQLGRSADAKQAFTATVQKMNVTISAAPDVFLYNETWFMLQIIRREAEGLIDGKQPATAPATRVGK